MAAIDSSRVQNNSETHLNGTALEALALSGQIIRNKGHQSPSRLLGKPFADIRVKLGQKKSP